MASCSKAASLFTENTCSAKRAIQTQLPSREGQLLTHVAVDFVLPLFPWMVIWKLQIRRWEKVGLCLGGNGGWLWGRSGGPELPRSASLRVGSPHRLPLGGVLQKDAPFARGAHYLCYVIEAMATSRVGFDKTATKWLIRSRLGK